MLRAALAAISPLYIYKTRCPGELYWHKQRATTQSIFESIPGMLYNKPERPPLSDSKCVEGKGAAHRNHAQLHTFSYDRHTWEHAILLAERPRHRVSSWMFFGFRAYVLHAAGMPAGSLLGVGALRDQLAIS